MRPQKVIYGLWINSVISPSKHTFFVNSSIIVDNLKLFQVWYFVSFDEILLLNLIIRGPVFRPRGQEMP